MKKVVFLTVVSLFLLPIFASAQDYDLSRKNPLLEFDQPKPKRFWATASYSGIINIGNLESDIAPNSKFGINLGGIIWNGLGLEFSFKAYLQSMVDLQYPETNEKLITSLGQTDIGVKAIYRPSFMLDDFPMMYISPYISAGVNFTFLPSYSIVKRPESRETYFGVFPAFKAGVHYSVLNFLIGVSVEYTFQQMLYNDEVHDFSNISIGIEAGAAF